MSSSDTQTEEKSSSDKNSTSISSSQTSSCTSGSPATIPLKMTWRTSVIKQLQARRQREIVPFVDLINLYNRTVEKTSSLQMESGQLSFMNEKLRVENEGLRSRLAGGQGFSSSSNVSNESNSERVSFLEKKLFALQEELTDLHRKRSENAQQIINQSSIFKENEKKLADTLEDLRLCRLQLEEAYLKISFLQSELSELQATNQLLKDEYQTLQLALSSSEQKLLEAKKENDSYLSKLLHLNEQLVQKVNAENELFRQRENQLVQQELEEAARESKRNVFMPKGSSGIPVGVECLESAICCMTRIPTRAYMVFDAHEGEVNAIKWSPHGLTLATGGADRKVKIWDISKGVAELHATLTGCNSSVMSLDFDAGGSYLLAASSGDFTSRVWSLEDNRLRHTLTGHSGKVFSAKFMGDSNKVVSASHDRTLKVWDLRSKSCVSTKFAGSSCYDLVCTDSNFISGHFDKKVRFWDSRASCNDPTSEIELQGKITSLDLAKNGHQLLVASRDDTLRLVDLSAVFSPDSEYVCVGSIDGSVLIWNVNQPSRVEKNLECHDSVVYSVAWQPAGNCLTTCDKNKKVIVWADL